MFRDNGVKPRAILIIKVHLGWWAEFLLVLMQNRELSMV